MTKTDEEALEEQHFQTTVANFCDILVRHSINKRGEGWYFPDEKLDPLLRKLLPSRYYQSYFEEF
jgi:hypothetical protein